MFNDDTGNFNISRRAIIKMSGMSLVGVWSRKAISPIAGQQPNGSSGTGKPIFLAPDDATDAAVHSRVENLFWCDVMMEHAGFFTALMPGPDLSRVRAQAEGFQQMFQSQSDLAKSVTFDRSNYARFNRSTVELIKPFIEYKQRIRDAQQGGKIRTLVFSLFFDHAAREAERAAGRLEKLSSGNTTLDFREVVDFWTADMSDHTQFIAHLLDPQEQDLITAALDSSAVFKGFNEGNHDRKLPGGDILLATEDLIDFETMIQDGINTGHVKSILHPAFADHIRRESVKFVDELKRAGTKT